MDDHATTTDRPRPARRARVLDARTAAWPLGLLLLLVAVGTWRGGDGDGARADDVIPRAELAQRSFGELRLDVPRDWVTLERTDTWITWGTADRSHLVTLSATQSAPDPLFAVVRQLAREGLGSIPGARIVAGPTRLEPPGVTLRRGDSIVAVELELDDGAAAPLRIVQAWRRDARAGSDLVATWTSADGTWPVDPRSSVPRTDARPA